MIRADISAIIPKQDQKRFKISERFMEILWSKEKKSAIITVLCEK